MISGKGETKWKKKNSGGGEEMEREGGKRCKERGRKLEKSVDEFQEGGILISGVDLQPVRSFNLTRALHQLAYRGATECVLCTALCCDQDSVNILISVVG